MEQYTSLIPNTVSKTMLCINEVTESDYSGVLYSAFMPEPVPFDEATSALGVMEQFFNNIAYPQSYFEDRTFLGARQEESRPQRTVTRYHEDDLFEQNGGALATFIVNVRYRQNATWQGDITWREQGLTRTFRSTLEMLRLIDGALGQSQPSWNS